MQGAIHDLKNSNSIYGSILAKMASWFTQASTYEKTPWRNDQGLDCRKENRGEASRISPAANEAIDAPSGNTYSAKRLAKPTQFYLYCARDPLIKMALQCSYEEDAS